jgi:hypothetical protein
MRIRLAIINIFLMSTLVSYSQIKKFEYKVMDEINTTYTQFLSTKTATLYYRLVSITNLDTDSTIIGIEVEVLGTELQTRGLSLSFSNFSSLWGTSAGINFEKLNYGGLIFISIEEALNAYDFLNEYFTKIYNTNPKFYENYKITINDNMEIGYFYEVGSNTWKFFTSVSNNIYSTEIMEGIELIKKFGEFARYYINN